MNTVQRIIIIVGSMGILHSAMVPPVLQGDEGTCRYHEFAERSLFFTRGYSISNGDIGALLSEFGIIAALTCLAYLTAGGFKKR